MSWPLLLLARERRGRLGNSALINKRRMHVDIATDIAGDGHADGVVGRRGWVGVWEGRCCGRTGGLGGRRAYRFSVYRSGATETDNYEDI